MAALPHAVGERELGRVFFKFHTKLLQHKCGQRTGLKPAIELVDIEVASSGSYQKNGPILVLLMRVSQSHQRFWPKKKPAVKNIWEL